MSDAMSGIIVKDSSWAGSAQRSPGQCHSQVPYEERCVDPPLELLTINKTDRLDGNGIECETTGFIVKSADPPSAAQTCSLCSSPQSCRVLMCRVLTCGLYRFCSLPACLTPNTNPSIEPEKQSLRGNAADHKEGDCPDWLSDVCIAGVKVEAPQEYLNLEDSFPSIAVRQSKHVSLQDLMVSYGSDESEENVDALITRKLLELFSEYQIDELARCTSDSVFRKKSREINLLISSLAEEHKMHEQEAECRLVREIIRISTRRCKARRPASRPELTLSDSGNETMKDSSYVSVTNNNDSKSDPNIEISELTTSDRFAREIWRNNAAEPITAMIQSQAEPEEGMVKEDMRWSPWFPFRLSHRSH
ncbi:uncharacterized protein kdf1b [Neosynchiropus ocellatus]